MTSSSSIPPTSTSPPSLLPSRHVAPPLQPPPTTTTQTPAPSPCRSTTPTTPPPLAPSRAPPPPPPTSAASRPMPIDDSDFFDVLIDPHSFTDSTHSLATHIFLSLFFDFSSSTIQASALITLRSPPLRPTLPRRVWPHRPLHPRPPILYPLPFSLSPPHPIKGCHLTITRWSQEDCDRIGKFRFF